MKQRIDHSNYEAWLLDRLEGKLTPEEEQQLAAFLALNRELDPGEGDLPTVQDHAERLDALDKEALKRHLPPVAAVDPLNIDDHLVARLENDLTTEQLEALRIFLVLHPEHQRAERTYALTKLVPQALACARKQELHRAVPPISAITRHTLDDFLVASLEGDLSAEQERALETFLAENKDAQRDWRLMQATRVRSADLQFTDKASLKKGGRVIAFIPANAMVRLAAAASIALLIGMAWWFMRDDDQPSQVADDQRVVAPANSTGAPLVEKDSATLIQQPSVIANDDRPLVAEGERVDPKPSPQPEEERDPDGLIPNEAPLPIAEQKEPVPQRAPEVPAPILVPLPEQPGAEGMATTSPAPRNTTEQDVNTVGEALTAALRERVLDRPADTSPLNGDDAVALVDRGLKALGGERSGLSVARDPAGRGKGFKLRLGRNLAISASR